RSFPTKRGICPTGSPTAAPWTFSCVQTLARRRSLTRSWPLHGVVRSSMLIALPEAQVLRAMRVRPHGYVSQTYLSMREFAIKRHVWSPSQVSAMMPSYVLSDLFGFGHAAIFPRSLGEGFITG